MPKDNHSKKSPKSKSSSEDQTPKVEAKLVIEAVKPPEVKKPDKFVTLLKGTQFTDRDSGDIYLLQKLTPVKEITTWVRTQERFGLFSIIE